MKFECSKCERSFGSKEGLEQHESFKHIQQNEKNPNFRKYIISLLIGLIVLVSVVTGFSYSQKSGDFDSFAKCLTGKGVIMYGNDHCSFTNHQVNYFGKSDKYINYVKCTDNPELCNSKGISITPTWEIEGKMYEQVQTFDKLSALTGCKI